VLVRALVMLVICAAVALALLAWIVLAITLAACCGVGFG
jgi:hypothetical protein